MAAGVRWVRAMGAQVLGMREGYETEAKASERARVSMMGRLGALEDEVLEREHELGTVREERDQHLRVILETQERVAREILLRKEEKVRLAARVGEQEEVSRQRESLIDSLMKQRQELQLRLGRMGDMERELEGLRGKLEVAGESKETLSKRCDSLADKTRGLEAELAKVQAEAARQKALVKAAEQKLDAAETAAEQQRQRERERGEGHGVASMLGARHGDGGGGGSDGAAAANAVGGGGGSQQQGGSGGAPPSPTRDEVAEYAKFLGMDVVADEALLWIAKEAMAAALPEGWTQHEDQDGFVYFYSSASQQSTYEHPMDGFYRQVYQRAKTTAERDPAALVQRTAQDTNLSPGQGGGGGGGGRVGQRLRSPGGHPMRAGGGPVSILRSPPKPAGTPGRQHAAGGAGGVGQPQPQAPLPPGGGGVAAAASAHFEQSASDLAQRLRALEAENRRLRDDADSRAAGRSSQPPLPPPQATGQPTLVRAPGWLAVCLSVWLAVWLAGCLSVWLAAVMRAHHAPSAAPLGCRTCAQSPLTVD
jgi:hypothetical protein